MLIGLDYLNVIDNKNISVNVKPIDTLFLGKSAKQNKNPSYLIQKETIFTLNKNTISNYVPQVSLRLPKHNQLLQLYL